MAILLLVSGQLFTRVLLIDRYVLERTALLLGPTPAVNRLPTALVLFERLVVSLDHVVRAAGVLAVVPELGKEVGAFEVVILKLVLVVLEVECLFHLLRELIPPLEVFVVLVHEVAFLETVEVLEEVRGDAFLAPVGVVVRELAHRVAHGCCDYLEQELVVLLVVDGQVLPFELLVQHLILEVHPLLLSQLEVLEALLLPEVELELLGQLLVHLAEERVGVE